LRGPFLYTEASTSRGTDDENRLHASETCRQIVGKGKAKLLR
jgi:hypothetical protein